MKSAENKSSLINFTDYLSAKYDADSINITHSLIDDEVHLKISVTNSKTPSRLTLVNKNTNNLKVIAEINVESQSSFELIDENNYEMDTSFTMDTYLGDGSVFELYRFNKFKAETRNSFLHTCSLSKNSTFKDYNFTTGSDLTKNQTKINLNEKNSNYIGSGVVISNSSKCENYLDIRHLSDSAKSDCSFKAVSRGKSNVSFNGKVFVDEKCFNTVSNQISKGLLMDKDSKVNLTPILEINNDDVICSHGAASGKADEEILFYLASRGIAKADAERLYIQGFLSEFIGKIDDSEMQTKGRKYIIENC